MNSWNIEQNIISFQMSGFVVRRLSRINLASEKQKQKTQLKIILQPNKIMFKNQQTNNGSAIVKAKLTNLFPHKIEFQIKQPVQPCFKVKCGKNVLTAGQSCQLFVFYNSHMNIGFYNDEFIIMVSSHSYHQTIPILVRSLQQIRKMKRNQRGQSKTKQNLKNIKLPSQNRHIGQNKRKAGIMLSINKLNNLQQNDYINTIANRIQNFQKQYIFIQNFLKDKAIKNQIYLGEKPVTKQKYYQILSFNLTIEMMIKQQMKQKILNRTKNKKTRFGPSVRAVQSIKLKWNKSKNQPRITYKKGLQKLFKQVRNFVIYHRFKKMNRILSIYRNLRQQENIQQPQTKVINKPQMSSLGDNCIKVDTVKTFQSQKNGEEDASQSIIWNEKSEDLQYQLELQEKKKHDYYCRKIYKIIGSKKQRNLGVDFTQFTLSPKSIYVDHSSQRKKHVFQIKPRIGFDSWIALQQSTPYNHELMGYGKMEKMYEWEYYPSFEYLKKSMHSGREANYENMNRVFQQVEINKKDPNYKNSFSLLDKKQTDSLILQQIRKQYVEMANNQMKKYKNWSGQELVKQLLTDNKPLRNNMQLCINKPHKQYSSITNQIKCYKSDYFCQQSQPRKFEVQKFISHPQTDQGLIYQIKRQNMIDFDEPNLLIQRKVEYIEHLCANRDQESNNSELHYDYIYSALNMNTNLLMTQHRNQPRSTQKKTIHLNPYTNSMRHQMWQMENIIKKQQQHYEEIIQNLDTNKHRKLQIANRKIVSFNEFIKNKDNRVFY